MYGELGQSDRTTAEKNFTRFMTRAGDADTLATLSLVAIENQIWTPVWAMPAKIKSYEARDIIAQQIGEACADQEVVITFLKGAYAGLRDIDFQQWDNALLACENPSLDSWMVSQVENPPDKMFDGKFDTLMGVFVKKRGAEALPHLAKGAIDAAASSGPFNTILQQMDAAVAPEFGGERTEADIIALRESLVQVAKAVEPDKAREVAEQLATAGDESAAASLLPSIYADRMLSDGGLLHAAADI